VILFDLDGTLVDTAHDLGRALNMQLALHHKPALTYEEIRPVASHGSQGLLALGFGITPESENFAQMRAQYLDLYQQVFTMHPVLLPEIEDLLNALDKRNIGWGIVTNKPRRFSADLIKATKIGAGSLHARARCLVCGDDVPQPKPSPASLLLACETVNVKPETCFYVGDAERDVVAGKAAGMKTVVALFGYLDKADTPDIWGADYRIQHPLALLALL
jgi:N-acetyl-D-muramate 6-phosphate phosphatase